MTLINRLVFFALLTLSICTAQTNVGRITGTVTDASGASVPDCPVDAVDPQGQKESPRTGQNGVYVFPSLTAGTYELRVEKIGFRSDVRTGVVLDASSQRTVNFR